MPKYRISIAKLDPVLMTWKLSVDGIHTRPRTDPNQRLCSWCFEIEDEEHFITKCHINAHEPQSLVTDRLPPPLLPLSLYTKNFFLIGEESDGGHRIKRALYIGIKRLCHERQSLYTKIVSKHLTCRKLGNHEKFIFLMSCKDKQVLTWLGKLIHKSFNIRNTKMYKPCIPSQ